MPKKKSTPRKAARVKDLASKKADKIKGGLLLASPQLGSSRFEGEGQPPTDLGKR
jgi:hypothetical protein